MSIQRFEVKAGTNTYYVYAENRRVVRARFRATFPLAKDVAIKLDPHQGPWKTYVSEGNNPKPGGHTYVGPKAKKG